MLQVEIVGIPLPANEHGRDLREPTTECLGKDNVVRFDAQLFAREKRPGSADTSLTLVGNQRSVPLGAELCGAPRECRRHRPDAPFTLNRLEHESRERWCIGEGLFQLVDVIHRDADHAQTRELELVAELGIGGELQRAECLAVKRAFERHEGSRARLVDRVFDRDFHRLGAAIGEHRAVVAADALRQRGGQARGVLLMRPLRVQRPTRGQQ